MRDQPERINLIKRKTKNENLAKKDLAPGVKGNELIIHPMRKFINFKEDKTKLNLGKMYKKAKKLDEIVNNLRKKVEVLEGKYDFLEFCNKEFGEKNKSMIGKLKKVLDKKQKLETIFSFLVQNFFPNLKLVDNSLPEHSKKNQIQNNNQISEIRNNELISQLFNGININNNNYNSSNNKADNKESTKIITNNKKNNNILNEINIIKNPDDNNNNNLICNNNQISQIMEKISDDEQQSNEIKEIKAYNDIMNFQNQYFKDLEEQNANNININKSLDSQNNPENNSSKSLQSLKNDKDILNVSSNNNSLSEKKFLNKKTLRDSDGSLSDGSKDLL